MEYLEHCCCRVLLSVLRPSIHGWLHLLAASLADEKALSIQYPSISPCCICKRDLPVCRLLGRDAHRRPVLQLRAGLSHQHVAIRPPRSQQAAGPGGVRPRMAWRQPAPRLLLLFASKGKPVRVRTSMLCYLLRRSRGQGQARPANPAGCFALRPPPASHACCVRGCTRIQFNSNRGGVQNQPVRPVWIAISLSLLSLLSTAIAAAVSSTPCRPAPPRPTRRRRRPLRLGFTNGALLLSNHSVRP